MALFGVGHDGATAGTNQTVISVNTTGVVRPVIYELTIGSDAAPADHQALFHILRISASGSTGTSLTAMGILSTAQTSSSSLIGGAFTTEPTFLTGTLLEIPLNRRATFRWAAAPGGGFAAGPVASSGIGLRCISAVDTAGTGVNYGLSASLNFDE